MEKGLNSVNTLCLLQVWIPDPQQQLQPRRCSKRTSRPKTHHQIRTSGSGAPRMCYTKASTWRPWAPRLESTWLKAEVSQTGVHLGGAWGVLQKHCFNNRKDKTENQGQGVPTVVQQKQIRLGSVRMQVWSLASLRGLRIQRCHELWCRLQIQLGSAVAVAVVETGIYSSDLTPSLGISMCHKCGPKKTKKKKKKKKDFLWLILLLFSIKRSKSIIYIKRV